MYPDADVEWHLFVWFSIRVICTNDWVVLTMKVSNLLVVSNMESLESSHYSLFVNGLQAHLPILTAAKDG